MKLKNLLKEAYEDQYGENNYLHTISLTIILDNGLLYNNLLYAFEDEKTITFYQKNDSRTHLIKIIKKENILSIKPQYKLNKKEEKTLEYIQ